MKTQRAVKGIPDLSNSSGSSIPSSTARDRSPAISGKGKSPEQRYKDTLSVRITLKLVVCFDIFNPSLVILDWVDRKANQFNTELLELWRIGCDLAKFSCTNWGVISGMREKNTVRIANVLMKSEVTWENLTKILLSVTNLRLFLAMDSGKLDPD